MVERQRCHWAEGDDALMRDYHDREWGVPLHDDRALFELLCLEGAQAGLSWRTVLHRRAHYRRAFHDFDIARVARLTDRALEKRLSDPRLIRNRLKIASVRDNARAALRLIAGSGSLDTALWALVGGVPKCNHWRDPAEVPAQTAVSERFSASLRKAGFRFVGPTICYAFMQASGMVNDHLQDCFRHAPCRRPG
ncbi:MAG TPA: DNA-3-methyladenine glycosylase I [Rhodanobacteraceae bacterium]|nr:DNA-3-methyladenine glycosylase I [Rhodanobacteraceae bacterium]